MPAGLLTLQRSPMLRQRLSSTAVMERQARSLRLDARELDHLGPFLGFGCNESAELGGAKNHWDGADIAEPRLDVRRSQPGIDLAVEPFDDLHWRAGGPRRPRPKSSPRIQAASRRWSARPAACGIAGCPPPRARAGRLIGCAAAMSRSRRRPPAPVRRSDR